MSAILDRVTKKAKGIDLETWCDFDSHCLLCNVPITLDDNSEWPDDTRLLLCWSCLSKLCEELLRDKQ